MEFSTGGGAPPPQGAPAQQMFGAQLLNRGQPSPELMALLAANSGGMPQRAPQGMPQRAPQGMPQMAPQGMPQMAPQGMGLPQLFPGGQQMFGAQLLNRVQPSAEMMAAPPTAPPGMQISINTPNFDALAAAQAATRDRAAAAMAGQSGQSGKGAGLSGLQQQQQVELGRPERPDVAGGSYGGGGGYREGSDNRFNGIY